MTFAPLGRVGGGAPSPRPYVTTTYATLGGNSHASRGRSDAPATVRQGLDTARSLAALPRSWGSVVALVVAHRISSTRRLQSPKGPLPVAPRALLAGSGAVQRPDSARLSHGSTPYSFAAPTGGGHA